MRNYSEVVSFVTLFSSVFDFNIAFLLWIMKRGERIV